MASQSAASLPSDSRSRVWKQHAVLSMTLVLLVAGAAPVIAQSALFHEPPVIVRSIDIAERQLAGSDGEVKNGVYPELSNMITGAGWLSLGPGYRQWLAGDRVLVDGSTAISWRAYKMAQARFELPALVRSRLAVGTQVRWQNLTQVTYFGTGATTVESNRSEYRLKSTNVVGYATMHPRRRVDLTGRAGWLSSPAIGSPSGLFRRGNPATQAVFPDDPVFAVSQQPTYAYGELSFSADTRDRGGRPTRGGLYRAALGAFSDRDRGAFSFRRTEVEGAHFVPLASARVVLAAHGWLVASATEESNAVPFYFLPSIGGHNTLRSYDDFRFHDRNALVLNAETRIALWPHLDAALFVDAGNVAARLRDLDVDRSSIGVGLRMHRTRSTFARIDVAHGQEGWRLVFRTSDPLRVSRPATRTAALPFVP